MMNDPIIAIPIIGFWFLCLVAVIALAVKLGVAFYQWLSLLIDEYEELEDTEQNIYLRKKH